MNKFIVFAALVWGASPWLLAAGAPVLPVVPYYLNAQGTPIPWPTPGASSGGGGGLVTIGNQPVTTVEDVWAMTETAAPTETATPTFTQTQTPTVTLSPTWTLTPYGGVTINGPVSVGNFPASVFIANQNTPLPYPTEDLTSVKPVSITNQNTPIPYPTLANSYGASIVNWLFSSSPTPQIPVSVINSITVANLTPQVVPTTYLVSASSALPVSLTGGIGTSITNWMFNSSPTPQYPVSVINLPSIQAVSITGGTGVSITNWLFSSSPTPQYPVTVVGGTVGLSAGTTIQVNVATPNATLMAGKDIQLTQVALVYSVQTQLAQIATIEAGTFGLNSGTSIIIAPSFTFTPTSTPTGTLTPTATPTPLQYSFTNNAVSSSAQTLSTAVTGYYNNLRGFSVTSSDQVTNGGFWITDGVATLWGPVTLGPNFATGINVDRTIYAQAPSRPILGFNGAAVSAGTFTGQDSIDLAGVK